MPDSLSPVLSNAPSLASRIRAVAELAEASRPDFRRIAFDLWALRIEAGREADTLDARMIDTACSLKERA